MAYQLVKSGKRQKDTRSDSQLMVDLCGGDEDAFSEVIRRFQGPIYGLLIRMLGNEDEAEELLQETFCRLHRYRENYDPERPLVTWIFTIASNLAKKRWRRRSRWITVPLDYVNLTSPGKTAPHYESGRVELRASLEEAIGALPPHYREPFLLREKQGMTYEQIAEVMDIRIGTVKSRINRARTRLRRLLKDTWENWK
ncbi:sigma-70 family RNA polymerase sigma factor [Candidatus Fermentibacteria bacterium]|nr:sigma-70 family RNA polymerase sigma factor [Candidatus Fermentibacteria bacterium]